MIAPFPYFGGKRKVAPIVWRALGNPKNYVEPFFGSGAVLLGRESPGPIETVNDLDGMVANFWRAVKSDPDAVAEFANWPVNENDLHARHAWLVSKRERLTEMLEGNPDWCDPQIAGWWVWGISCWIGSGFCSGRGPWVIEDGRLVRSARAITGGIGRQLVHLGRGVNRKLVHLGNAGRGVNRKLVHLGNAGRGVSGDGEHGLVDWMHTLSTRLSRVRVCSGQWDRICGPSVTYKHGLTGVFLDPPYADTAERTSDLYACDSESAAHKVREWAVEAGERQDMRIVLCGYEGEHQMPDTWRVVSWKPRKGYAAASNTNNTRERLWLSPACLSVEEQDDEAVKIAGGSR